MIASASHSTPSSSASAPARTTAAPIAPVPSAPAPSSPPRFHAFAVSLELVRSLRAPLARHDRSLADQLSRAANSVGLNVAEGNRRKGGDRLHHFRIAAGSAEEVEAALRLAEAWGHLDAAAIAPALGYCDRVLAMLWRLAR